MELLLLIMIFTNEMKNHYKIKGLLEIFFFFFFSNQNQGVGAGEGKSFEVSEIFSLRSEVSGDVTHNTDQAFTYQG